MKTKKRVNLLNIKSLIKYIFFTSVIVIVCCFFISKKENLFIDEMFTYGLSNNQFMLVENDYQIYSGEKVLLDYVSVKKGQQFNFSNVIFNQEHDTHPPIYYLIVNFISSLNPEKFSLWYGLIINVFFMVVIYWEMYYLIFNTLEDETFALLAPIISIFFYGFINQIVFTRMYVMLSAISLLFIIHIYNYIKMNYVKKNNLMFYVILFFIIIFGTLTQYHFLIYLFIISILFLSFLLSKKDYYNIIKYFFTIFISIITSIILFPKLLDHILGESSQHNILKGTDESIFQKLQTMIKNYEQLVFGKSFIWYFILFLLLIFLMIYISRKYKIIFSKNNYFFISTFSVILTYFIIIVLTVRLSYDRYLFNLMPLTSIFLSCLFYKLFKFYSDSKIKNQFIIYIVFYILITILSLLVLNLYNISKFIENVYLLFFVFAFVILLIILYNKGFQYKYLTLFIIFSMTLASHNRNVNYMYKNDNMLYNYMTNNRDVRTILVYQKSNIWKMPYPLWTFRDMEEIVFVNSDNENWEKYGTVLNNEKLFVFIYATQNDTMILNKIASSNNVQNIEPILKTSYISGYYLD